jgi:hypothetical protein
MPTFEFLSLVRNMADARDVDRAESMIREELEGACLEILDIQEVK